MGRMHRRWIGLLGLPLVLTAATSFAGPAPAEAPAEAAAAPAPAAPATKPVATIRRDMEVNMGELGELAEQARRDTDLVRAACVLDKQDRAQGVMELATSELLVIRDSNATAESRQFAAEKLAAASERLDDLVEQAKTCSGDTSPELADDETNNDADEVPLVPEADPTQSGGSPPPGPSPAPPTVNDGRPPTVGSPSQ